MATGPLAPVIHYLRKVTSPAAFSELPDAELLARFARQRDEAAFTALVRRHGPMVLAVCRRVVRDGHAAEDAFQATFLVLARKADSLAQPALLGHWLYGVAYRTAMKARREATKRRDHEMQVVRVQEVGPSEEIDGQDLRAVLDEEINRLPERYRVPVVLCYLQGQTNAEAARRLGCSRGTIATLLARARDKLRRRLTQRGIGLSVGAALGALTPTVRGGMVPLALENVTVKAATLLSAGHTQAVGALAGQAVALAKGVSKGMLFEKLKIPVAILIVTALVGTGAGVSTYRAGAPGTEVAESEQEVKPRPQNKTEGPRKHVSAPAGLPEAAKTTCRTANFVVTAPTVEIARQVGEAAEHNRKALAQLWLGKELPVWEKPCPVRVTITEKNTDSACEFGFEDGVVISRRMFLEGPLDRIFADLLPHEITHTILAEWRGRPVPRWADEGAAMLSESTISRAHHEQSMEKLLRRGRPTPLTELLPRPDYPKDVTAFYAQSFSLTDFLVSLGGRKKFLAFVAKGMDNNWNKAARLVYGYETVGGMEQAWLKFAQKRVADKRGDEVLFASFKRQLPSEYPPAPVLVILDENGYLSVLQRGFTVQPVLETVISENGRELTAAEKIKAKMFKLNMFNCAAVYDFDTVRVHDTKGREVDKKELRKRLKGETLALVLQGNERVDPLYLRLYKEDTLIFLLQAPPLRQTGRREGQPAPPVAPLGPAPAPPGVAPPARVDESEKNVPPSGS